MAKEVRKVHISVSSNASTSLNKGTASATGLSGALKGVGASANLATGGIKSMAAALVSSGIGAIVVSVGALIGGLGTLINKSKDFSKELSGLKAILGRDTDPLAIKELATDAKRLGSETAFTALQVVQLQTEFAKLGFTTNQILNATEATLSLAAATETDLAEAASVAGATLRGFGLAASETQRVVDVMAKSFSKSSLDMSSFTESMKLVAPIAKTIKVPIEQATAALGVLANQGVKGSMAGTQLRRVMSDLAQKTGVSFRESLTLTAEKLKNATSDSEKLAIAKELVGDRAKGSVIALAENVDMLDQLTLSLNKAGGAAKQMAEDRLDNLSGDLTKLSSAWEGFILGLEDGNGIISRLSRSTIQVFTGVIQKSKDEIAEFSLGWDMLGINLQRVAPFFKTVWQQIKIMGLNISKFGAETKIALADVPFIGGAIDKEATKNQLAELDKSIAQAKVKIKKFAEDSAKIDEEAAARMKQHYQDRFIARKRDEKILEGKINEEFRQGETKKDEEAAKKAEADRLSFLSKLKKLEQDTDDQTELEKIERKRQRHLAELDTLKLNHKEKEDAKLAIEGIYDELRARQKAKNLEKFNNMFGTEGQDPLLKIQKDRENHLLALDALEISETEKEELKKRIREHYDSLRDQANATNLEKKRQSILAEIDEERKLAEEKRRILYGALDTAAQVAGEETAMAKALMAIKLSMQLKELGIKMGLIKDELAVKANAAMAEAGIEGAKVGTATAQGMAETSKIGFPWNVITMAGYALQAASLIKTFAGQKKKLKAITSSVGGTSGGGGTSAPAAPPSFNVIGGTSAGDEMVASTIASVNQNPIKAYVVSSDVTTSQELQRNTETIASIG